MFLTLVFEVESANAARAISMRNENAFFSAVTEKEPKFTDIDYEIETKE